MSDINTVKAQIQSLIDLANETTGNQDTNLTDGVNALVSGFGQGGSGGIEGGYDVTFYDEWKEELALYSVKEGHEISKPPKYSCLAWQTIEGATVSFPYVPTSDISLYANSDTYADQLYKFYGVDKAIYPYVLVALGGNSCVYFFDKIVTNTESMLTINGSSNNKLYRKLVYEQFSISDYSDLAEVCEVVMNKIPSVVEDTGAYNPIIDANFTCYSNFDIAYSNISKYRLDEAEETLPFDGLANGYDVMFYDENNEGLAFYSIRKGDGINAPVYNAKKWLDNNGNVVVFPYVPTSDILLYADQSGCVSVLYELYGISPVDYPYMIISYCISTQRILIYFCDKYDVVDNKVRVWKKTLPIMTDFVDTTLGTNPTIEEIVVALQGGDNTLYANPDSVYYINNSVGSYDNYILFTNITDTIQTTSQVIVIE